jgi:hypothetical protein
MQKVGVINQRQLHEQLLKNYEERQKALAAAVDKVLGRVLGCWRHDLSRPFSRGGTTYRVCLKCGMRRKFDLVSWKTHGKVPNPVASVAV